MVKFINFYVFLSQQASLQEQLEMTKASSQAQVAEHRQEVERLHSQSSDLRSQLDAQMEKFNHLQKETQERTTDLEEVNLKLANLESDLQIRVS